MNNAMDSGMTILADDLTGANDTAIQYTQHGLDAIVMTQYTTGIDLNNFKGYQVVACNTNSRGMEGDKAYSIVKEAAKAFFTVRHDTIYKKVDSLLRGNPGYELKAVMDAIRADIAFVVPAYPDNGRIVRDGILQSSNKEVDLLHSFTDQTGYASSLITLQMLELAAEQIARQIVENFHQGIRLFIFDSISQNHFIAINKIAQATKLHVVYCGSAGFAPYVPQVSSFRLPSVPVSTCLTNEKTLVVCGTRNPVTQTQIRYALQYYGTSLCLLNVHETCGDAEIMQTVSAADAQFASGRREVFLAVSSIFDDVDTFQLEKDDKGAVARMLALRMGYVAAEILERHGPFSIIATGGDTALQIVNALASYGMIPRNEIAPGIPLVSLVGGKGDGIEMITKSGGFGKESVIVDCIEYLRREK